MTWYIYNKICERLYSDSCWVVIQAWLFKKNLEIPTDGAEDHLGPVLGIHNKIQDYIEL